MTSCGLFHQPANTSAAPNRNISKASGREASSSSSATKHHRRAFGDEALASAAPAFEAAADNDRSDSAVNEHSSELLERHTSAAKDGVIDILTAKASKLGVSLERALLAKKEAEDSAERQQVLLDGEAIKRKDVEHKLQQKEEEFERFEQENGHLKWEVDALRVELQDAEARAKEWVHEEAERRRSAEEAMTKPALLQTMVLLYNGMPEQEHAVATEYLAGVYRNGNGPEIWRERGATVAEVLVRELQGLRDALREREDELGECAERLEKAVSDAKSERERYETVREQLTFTQERFEAAKHKARQLSGQLETETGENEALRTRLQAMEEENDMRTRSLQERKAKAQQRKRAKDDRIKSLESTLMKERARLEEELQSARSDYEEAAKESRRKTARLQRRCLELEYRVATQSNGSDGNSGEGGGVGGRGGDALPPTAPSSSSLTPPVAGLISAASMLPWRRGTASSEASTSASTASIKSSRSRLASGSAAAAAAATPAATTTRRARERGGGRGEEGAQEREAAAAGSYSSSSSTAGNASGARRASADRLPDPSRHNEAAPAWMREDLAVDRVRVD
eukprot:g15012.t1